MHQLSLYDCTSAELADAAGANLAVQFAWAQQQTPGMYASHEDDLVWGDSGLPCDTFNAICRSRLTPTTAQGRIRTVIGHFAAVERPFSWWLCPGDLPSNLGELLLASGLQRADTELAMAANLGSIAHGECSPAGLQIERVCSLDRLHDFVRIIAQSWTPPDLEVLRFYDLTAPVLFTDDVPFWLYVGYFENEAVATAQLTFGGGVAGLYSIITIPSHRRRGIGAALTLRLLRDAQALGFRTAILQASAAGAPLYTRVGFVPFGQIVEYKPVIQLSTVNGLT